MVHWRIQFFGVVQGVWFRRFVQEQARDLGITGWVRNESDGSVLAECQHPEVQVLEQWMQRCAEGPPLAKVERIDVTHMEEVVRHSSFEILR
jgi:acylphosphatase